MEENHASEQLKRYKQTLNDIRYILKTYRRTMPEAAWETIRKLAHDPKLRLKNIKGQSNEEVVNGERKKQRQPADSLHSGNR